MGLLGFGRKNPFPYTFGGGESAVDTVHEALLDAYAPAWDVSDEGDKSAEAYAQALAVSFVWAANRRLSNQGQPRKMLEFLTTWEEATRLRGAIVDRAMARRHRLAAKLRGIAGNTLSDIEAACRELLGPVFIALRTTPDADEIVYWPGMNPGPPGFEWSTNRCTLRVQLDKGNLGDAEFDQLVGELSRVLDGQIPAWMTFVWFVGEGFHVGESKLGEDIL